MQQRGKAMRYRRVEGHNNTSDHRELCIALTLAEKDCGHHTQCYPNNKGSHTQWVVVFVYLRIARYFANLRTLLKNMWIGLWCVTLSSASALQLGASYICMYCCWSNRGAYRVLAMGRATNNVCTCMYSRCQWVTTCVYGHEVDCN